MRQKFIFLISLFLIVSPCSGHADSLKENVRAAEKFEALLFSASPKTRRLISYIDVSSKDQHLIVNAKRSFLNLPKSQIDALSQAIYDLWVGTKYVRERGYGGWIQVKFWDDQELRSIPIKTLR